MIVDFPCDQKQRLLRKSKALLSPSPESATRTKAKRSVCFSDTSRMTIIERASPEELKRRWYTKKDREAFGLQHKKDIRATLRKLANTPMQSISQDDLFACVGIELYLSYDILTKTPERRYNHVWSILGAQHRQRRLHINNVDELSRISSQSSEWATSRSQSIAAMYMMIPKKNNIVSPTNL